MIKKVYIDTETTDSNPETAGLISLSAIIKIDGKIVDRFSTTMKPYKGSSINEESLNVNGLTIDKIKTFIEGDVAFLMFEKFLSKHINKFDKKDKAVFVGYNAPKFDETVLRNWFKNSGSNFYGSWFYTPSLCILQKAFNLLILKDDRTNIENAKLKTMCEFFGIQVDESKTHDAAYDIALTVELDDVLDREYKAFYSK